MIRLIDADAAYKAACEGADNWDGGCSPYRDDCIREEMDKVPTASPWHRVEDGMPKPHKEVLVSGMEAINNSRVYKVMVNDNGTWRPTDYAPSIRWDYWMPIEPPKEDA